jgi:hypothetical protein
MLLRYGSVHYLSELGPKGERAIQKIKPIIVKNQGVGRDNWVFRAARDWGRRQSMKTFIKMVIEALRVSTQSPETLGTKDTAIISRGQKMIADFFNSVFPEDTGEAEVFHSTKLDSKKAKYFHVYKNRRMVSRLLVQGGTAISAVLLSIRDTDTCLYATAISHKSGLRFAPIRAGALVSTRGGCAFFHWSLDQGPDEGCVEYTPDQVTVDDAVVLLPCLCGDLRSEADPDNMEVSFYTITYSWREMDGSGNLVVYRLDKNGK